MCVCEEQEPDVLVHAERLDDCIEWYSMEW